MTEFGRIADWPSLEPNQLYQNRDLRAVLKGLHANQFGLSDLALANLALANLALGEHVFPHSGDITPMRGLIA